MLLTEARSWNPHALAGRWDPVDVVVVGGSPFLLVSDRYETAKGRTERAADIVIIIIAASRKKRRTEVCSEAT